MVAALVAEQAVGLVQVVELGLESAWVSVSASVWRLVWQSVLS